MWVRSRSARSVEIVETSSDESAERSPGVFLAELPIEAVGISMGLWVVVRLLFRAELVR